MSDLRMFFDERKSEVDVYFNFIKYIGIGECFDFNIIGEDYVYKG